VSTQTRLPGISLTESALYRRDLTAPVLAARPGGRADRLGAAFAARGVHPALTFLVMMVAGLGLCIALSIGCGLVATRVLEHVSGESFDVWLAGHRTPSLSDASLIGSIVGGGVVLPIIAGVVALLCIFLTKWRIGAFVVFALGVESATYRATTLVIHSHRPRVIRLEHLPVNASYPSGHTAASIAVYCGLALLLSSTVRSRGFQVGVWLVAIAFPPFVALARMYRGMHHPIDVAGGVVVGIAALIAIGFACRVAGAADEHRQ
jgi:membrane-associated phospholipid phosphatase